MSPQDTTVTKEEEGSSMENVNLNGEPDATVREDQKKDDDTPSILQRLVQFYWDQEFLILVVIVILLARAYPPLGADYLQPEITATWMAVIFIFVMAGLGLKTKELFGVLGQWKFHAVVQIFNLGVVSGSVYGISRALSELSILNTELADGMVVCASLPMTINMVLVLTKAADGDEAAAIFNAALGNMLGVFLSPVLILGYLGVEGDMEIFTVFYKLALRVLLPVAIGQVLQNIPAVFEFVQKHKPKFKKAQMYSLVFIVYTVFCRTFERDENGADIADIFLMILFQFILLSSFMAIAWYIVLRWAPPRLRVMGLFGCTHKTVGKYQYRIRQFLTICTCLNFRLSSSAMGIPLINAIYEERPDVIGLYTLPLLIWHPMQLVLGTFLAPRLSRYVQANTNDSDGEDEPDKPDEEEDAESSKEDDKVVEKNEETR